MNLETVIQSEVRREKQTLYINAYGGGLIAKSCLTLAAPWTARLLCPWGSSSKNIGNGLPFPSPKNIYT